MAGLGCLKYLLSAFSEVGSGANAQQQTGQLLGIAQRTVVAVFDCPSQRFSRRKLIPVNVKTLGDHLHLQRIKASLSQREVAQKAGVSIRTVRKWECGQCEMTNVTEPSSKSALRPKRSMSAMPMSVITKLVKPTMTDCISALASASGRRGVRGIVLYTGSRVLPHPAKRRFSICRACERHSGFTDAMRYPYGIVAD